MSKHFALSLIAAAVLATSSLTGHAHGPSSDNDHSASPPEQQAWGILGDESAVDREVDIRMDDTMRFYPDHLDVEEGETLRLVIHNDGQLLHELVLGTPEELAEHAALMARFPNMEHDDPWMVHVDPGQAQDLIWTFNRAGRFDFACLLPGHFEAGMQGSVTIAADDDSSHASHH
ncbi:cupredoxin domain-containing protein [Halopseudomonas salegens]|uniref:Uncharacterized copper-binding protein, cupredoxin-like subfamily n=1 Tax=Halopseudomonas salegens TaxID=1434072 RepID=A0A1H2DYZ5_9GAMM|nr:cupredoxin family protein [Halopseudomonas salegens]SDT88009.1 Uncharacterized copper-binding protein, cupredoxin-like subfamily [Halopseudomonas salegens]